MKNTFSEILVSIRATLVFAVVCCGIYPVLVWGAGQLFFFQQANGSLLKGKDGSVLGSALVGQGFAGDKYFTSRPSAAGNGYDPTSSSGSNLGPTSQKLHDQIAQNIAGYRKQNGLADGQPVPADAVTASGSGLDPHISVANALLQVPRVAKVRNLPEDQVKALVEKYTEGPGLGFLGAAGVNVLKLNLALDGTMP